MKNTISPVLALALAFGSTAAFAGGPVVVVEEPVVEAEKPRSGWIVPVIIGLVVVCAIACGDDDEDPAPTATTPTGTTVP
jgi:hypothetical protein